MGTRGKTFPLMLEPSVAELLFSNWFLFIFWAPGIMWQIVITSLLSLQGNWKLWQSWESWPYSWLCLSFSPLFLSPLIHLLILNFILCHTVSTLVSFLKYHFEYGKAWIKINIHILKFTYINGQIIMRRCSTIVLSFLLLSYCTLNLGSYLKELFMLCRTLLR